MSKEEFEKIRDKDHVVLQHIQEGREDVQKITAQTTLENHHVSYCFEKLEKQGLITVEKPDRMVERIVDGQKRVFQHPKKAELTGEGDEYLENAEQEDAEMYEDLSHREVVNKLHDLEDEVARLQDAFEAFRKQVQQKIR